LLKPVIGSTIDGFSWVEIKSEPDPAENKESERNGLCDFADIPRGLRADDSVLEVEEKL
jgi:hypothetical protein